jgi:hypothetical protein
MTSPNIHRHFCDKCGVTVFSHGFYEFPAGEGGPDDEAQEVAQGGAGGADEAQGGGDGMYLSHSFLFPPCPCPCPCPCHGLPVTVLDNRLWQGAVMYSLSTSM